MPRAAGLARRAAEPGHPARTTAPTTRRRTARPAPAATPPDPASRGAPAGSLAAPISGISAGVRACSRINPFLRWDTGLIKGPDGASYLGDAGPPHAITGSDLGTNFFRIDGPDIGGPGINTIQTNLFTLQGRVATNAGVAPTAVTYTRTTTSGGFIDAFAPSQPDQVIQVSGTGISTTKLKADATGNYFGRVAFTGATHRHRSMSPTPPTDHRRR